MARRHARARRLLWGIFGYVVTSLGALATTWLTSLEVSPLVGSLLATGGRPMLGVIGGWMDHAQQEGAEEFHPGRRTRPLSVALPAAGPAPGTEPVDRDRAGGDPAALRRRVVRGRGMALNGPGSGRSPSSRSSPSPSERKLEDPGVERLGGTTSNTTQGVLTMTVTSVRVNDQVTVPTVTTENQGSDR